MFISLRRWFQVPAVRGGRLRTLRSLGKSGSRQRRSVGQFEILESRALLTTFNVMNLADSGTGSLRAALLAAEANPGPDVVQFARQVQGTITLTSGELLISSDLTIKGPGANRLTISGNDASRVFHILGGDRTASAISVGISDLTVSHGRATGGAGINEGGFAGLTLARMTISNNQASMNGAGIQSAGSGAVLSLTDSLVANNTLLGDVNASEFFVEGGGIAVFAGTAQINHSTIVSNNVIGPQDRGVAVGSGIANDFGATMTITNSTINKNRATGGADGGEAHGGGIANLGSTLSISKSTISDNMAIAADGVNGSGDASGGAIDINFAAATDISDSLISNNRAIAGNGGMRTDDDFSIDTAFGGGISNAEESQLTVTRCILVGNQAIGGNHASTTAPNTADIGSAHGGGIINDLSSVAVIRDSTIFNNKSTGGNNDAGSGPLSFVGTATGGGIDNSIDLDSFIDEPPVPAQLTVINSLIAGNEAIGGNGNTGGGAGLPWLGARWRHCELPGSHNRH